MKTRLLLFLLFAFSFGNAQTISTMAGSTQGYVEGTGSAARFNRPSGITYVGGSRVIVTDTQNSKVRNIFSDNSTSLLAGSTAGFVNGTGAAARFDNPQGVVQYLSDTFVCDAINNCIRKISSSGVVTTFAGGTQGTADGLGTAAQFNFPSRIAVDASGNLYVSDISNHRIRKITPAGVVTTLAGSTNGYADGTGAAAQFSFPYGIVVDDSGNVFVGENCRIRKITPAGVVTTFAGGIVGYADGTGTAAQFNNGILGIAIDNSNNLYVTDSYNYRIRKITPAGVVSTYAGLGFSGTTDGDVSVANFDVLTGITINPSNNFLYVTDHFNDRIRIITPPAPATSPSISGISATPSSSSATINYSLSPNNGATTSVVKYGLTSSNLSSQVVGFSAVGNSLTPGSAIINGILPNTLYYYQIEAANSAGTVASLIGSFTTTTPPSFQIIAEYNFNNTYNNVLGNSPFASNGGTTFTTDRSGSTNSALNINNTGSTATILNLPYGNSSRTIAFWAKLNTIQNPYNFTFSYGQGSVSNAIGGSFNSSSVDFFGYANNLSATSSNSQGVWYFFTYTYDGTNAKIYKNGTLLNTVVKSWNTLNASNLFKLGIGVGNEFDFNGAIDDLKIFNNALDGSQILELYNTNTVLSSQDFNDNNLQASLYPNPVRDILNIEIENDIQSIEIYNIQGQKVLSSNQKQLNVSDLATGMYMVRIQDIDNNIATKKIVIK